MRFRNFFLPHSDTHHKAHFISTPAFLIYILFFVLLQMVFNYLPKSYPGVLGISSGVDQQELIRLTNEQRAQKGLGQLRENQKLNEAALQKGKNMFEEDYWAHYSPSGKDPWGFIQSAGYKFSYAGENLARNFYKSDEVVKAWMESPTHRDNMLNNHYQEIGIAVLEGTLKGEKTTLVVQEFGRPIEALADVPVDTDKTQLADKVPTQNTETSLANLPKIINPPAQVAGQEITIPNVSIDPFKIVRNLGLGLLGFVFMLILLDMYIIRRRGIVRLAARSMPHLALLGVGTTTLLNSSSGQILTGVSIILK